MNLEMLKGQINPWKNTWINIENTNCYAFALGLDIPQEKICECAFDLGHMYRYYNQVKPKYIPHDLLLQYDFKTLELIYRESSINEPLGSQEWKIAYFDTQYECGFHFFRQTENGIWWHKFDYGFIPTCLDEDNKIIANPKDCNVDFRGLNYQKCYTLKKIKV